MNVEAAKPLFTMATEPFKGSTTEPLPVSVCEPLPLSEANLSPITPAEATPLGLLELILKAPERLDRMVRDPVRQAELLPRFLGISLAGFAFFGVAMALVLSTSGVWPKLYAMEAFIAGREAVPLRFAMSETDTLLAHWLNGDAFRLIGAYAIGLVAATGICLPSLYFYSLLAGVKMTMMDVVVQALKSKAVAAVTLVGVLPIYATCGLAIAIFQLPPNGRDALLILGLALPFIAGTAGTYSLYRGLSGFADTMVAERREERGCFLQRLVLSWATCYSAVTPVLIFTLWQKLQG